MSVHNHLYKSWSVNSHQSLTKAAHIYTAVTQVLRPTDFPDFFVTSWGTQTTFWRGWKLESLNWLEIYSCKKVGFSHDLFFDYRKRCTNVHVPVNIQNLDVLHEYVLACFWWLCHLQLVTLHADYFFLKLHCRTPLFFRNLCSKWILALNRTTSKASGPQKKR